MHVCLKVDEIIRLIASKFVALNSWASAVSLACCCKNFEDPVLDMLWGTQSQLLPLLKSFPADIWNEDKCVVSTPTTHILPTLNSLIWKSCKTSPTTMEWVHFQKYAQRMRELNERDALDLLFSRLSSIQQLYAINKPLFLNLGTFRLQYASKKLIPSIPLFLSPRTTVISISFNKSDFPKVIVTSMITTFPTLCPNLQEITLQSLLRDPMIAIAVSKMVLASNQNTLQRFQVDSQLLVGACEVIFKLPDLRELLVVIEKGSPLPSMVLPSLTDLAVKCDHGGDWL